MNNNYLTHILSIIEEAIKRKKTTAARASKEAVGNFFLVRNMQKGQSPRLENIKKLCDVLGLECYIGFSEDYPGLNDSTPVLGKTENGKLLCEHNLSRIDKKKLNKCKITSAPVNKDTIVSFMINDDDLSPILSAGDTIFIDLDDKCDSSQCEQFVGKLCIVQVKNKNTFICILRRGDIIGKWNLEPLDENKTMTNQVLTTCFPIHWIKKAI